MPRLKTFEELKQLKVKLENEYKDKIPTYLQDYLDAEEKNLLTARYYAQLRMRGNNTSKEERVDFKATETEEFWNSNSAQIVKQVKDGRKIQEYSQSPIAEERVDDERDLTPEELLALKVICRDDLYLFAIRYFPHYLKRPSSKLHKFLYKTISNELSKHKGGIKWAIAAPRGNAKSSLVSTILPIWCVCYQKKRFVIMLSNTASQAEDFVADIRRELEFNVKLQKDFPEACGKGPTWKVGEIVTNNYVKILGLGTGSQVRGRRFGVFRPDLVIGDDLENDEMVRSETQRLDIRYNWFNKDVIFAGGEEGSTTDFFIVGTVLGKESLLNKLLDPSEYPEWKCKRFSAVTNFSTSPYWDQWAEIFTNSLDENRKDNALKFFEEHKEDMLCETMVLWPEGDPYYNLMIYRLSNPAGFYAEKQNMPVDPGAVLTPFNVLRWEYFEQNHHVREILETPGRCFFYGALDPSLGKKQRQGDYAVICTVARDIQTGTIFVIHFVVKRWSVEEQIEAILKMHDKYHYRMFGIETNAFQYVVAQTLRKRSKESGIYIPIKEITAITDKKMRYEGVVPFVNDGTVVFDKQQYTSNQQYQLAINQITTFTGIGDEADDAVDAFQMAFEVAKAPRFKMLNKRTRED